MPNEHLKTALNQAGLTIEQFADVISVDPKTVQRWVAGRTPYARHRATVSRALDIPEHQLWPDTVTAPGPLAGIANTATDDCEVIGAWGYLTDDGAPNPLALLADPAGEIDIIDPTGILLRMPGMAAALQANADSGAQLRILTDQTGLPETFPPPELSGTCRNPVEWPGFELLRSDDNLLLAIALEDDDDPPLLAIQRGTPGVFNRLLSHMDRVWETSTPLLQTEDEPAPELTPAEPPPQAEEEPARRWPRRPS